MLPPRLTPLLRQFDFARTRLADRMTGPVVDSGDGTDTEVGPLTDAEYHWRPAPDCWTVRRRADGPGPRATHLAGAGAWGYDTGTGQDPWPPPFTTIAWRLTHLSELLTLRADHTAGRHALTRADYVVSGEVAEAIAAFDAGATAWRAALLDVDDAALDTPWGTAPTPTAAIRRSRSSTSCGGSTRSCCTTEPEIALLRDLYRVTARQGDAEERKPG